MQEILDKVRSILPSIDHIEFDGRIHKIKLAPNDQKKSGWYCGFSNFSNGSGKPFQVVTCENYWTGEKDTFTSGDKELNAVDRAVIKRQIAESKAKSEAERMQIHEKVSRECNSLWETLTQSGQPDYFRDKGFPEGEFFGCKSKTKVLKGNTCYVPMRDKDGRLWSIQEIRPDFKGYTEGGRVEGLFHQIGELLEGQPIRIVEGLATGITVYLATHEAVFVAFQSGNLTSVAYELKLKYPDREFIICGDDDVKKAGNAGRKKATEAAEMVNGTAIFPSFENVDDGTDFDDLRKVMGIEEVQRQLSAGKVTTIVDTDENKEHFAENFPYPQVKGNGKPKGTIDNVRALIQRLGIVVRYNVISKEEEILIPGESYSMDNKANATFAYILSWCERAEIPHGNLKSYITAIAEENLYNPVVNWVTSKEWDGHSRIKKFADTIKAVGEDDNAEVYALKHTLIRKWMIGAIAAAFNPRGISTSGVLVLQGKQNIGKTHWFKKLVPRELGLMKDGATLKPSDKDSILQAICYWIVELGELDSTFKYEISQLKAFITKDSDVIRRPYAAKDSTYTRRTVFGGSVNEEGFLKDSTGNRRWWTIACESIDHHHDFDMQQVWAEIFYYYDRGESWNLEKVELNALNNSNAMFEEVDPVAERILHGLPWSDEKVLTKMHWLPASIICRQIGIQNPTKSDTNAAARILREMGCAWKRTNRNVVFHIPLKIDEKPIDS